MSKTFIHRVPWVLVVGIAGVVCLRCLNPFSPRLDKSIGASDIVTNQANPGEVLQNFKIAYTFRDSLLYSDLLDTGFVFVYFDPDAGTSGNYVSWGRDVDLTATGRLFRHFTVIDLVWNTTLYEFNEEDRGELSRTFNLTLAGTDSDYHLSGRAVFSFRKCADSRWRITRWKDETDS
jgi:hypothetical protein